MGVLGKYKHIFLLIVILLFAFFLRMMSLNKVYGLWFDEMIIFNQASEGFPFGIIKSCIMKDVHMPLYQVLLGIWMRLFGLDDNVLRFFSVLLGFLGVLGLYYAGKRLGDENTGIVAAFLGATSAILIYYSQEVKFYILLALFASLSAAGFIGILKNSDRKSFLVFVLANLGIIYTFTAGLLFSASQIAVLAAYFLIKKPRQSKYFLISLGVLGFASLPALFVLFNAFFKTSSTTLSLMSMFEFDASSWLFLLQNWFSPVIAGGVFNQTDYFSIIFAPQALFKHLFLVFIPLGLFFAMLVTAMKRNFESRLLAYSGFLFLIFIILAYLFSDFVPTVRYTFIIVPIFLLVFASGICSLKNKPLKILIILFLGVIYSGYAIFSPESAAKKPRPSGCKPPMIIMKKYAMGKEDVVLTLIDAAPRSIFSKYYKYEGYRFDANSIIYNPKIMVFQEIAATEESAASDDNLKDIFRPYLANQAPHKGSEKVFKNIFFNKLKKGRYLMIIYPKEYSNKEIARIAKDDKSYSRTPLYKLPIYKFANDMITYATKYLKLENVYSVDVWDIYVFQRQ